MNRWPINAAALAATCFTIAFSPPISADEADEAEVTTEVDAEGAAEYKDVQTMHDLEDSSFVPTVLGVVGPFNPDLLAPSTGTLAAVQRDSGRVVELLSGKRSRVGAELLTIPAVRERFEHTTMFGLTVHDEPSVRAYLDFFDGRGKPILAKWLSRMGRYETLIEHVLEEEGLPGDLIYVAMIESGFSPYATSPAAAAGVWQFIPTTATDMGLRVDRWVDERRDPVKATHAAARYLKLLYSRFESWPLALAAYNAGAGLMRSEIEKHNSNNYWRIQSNRGMYDETRRYVPKIIAGVTYRRCSQVELAAMLDQLHRVVPDARLEHELDVAHIGRSRNHQCAAVQQRAIHLPYGKIEAERVRRYPDIVVTEVEIEVLVAQQTHDIAMRDFATFGLARRTGGVYHIGNRFL
mgnify:CR=1 FL=1